MQFFNKNAVAFNVRGLPVILLPEKAVYLPDFKAILLSDLHLGKINHFRKSGIPVPARAQEASLENLLDLILQIKPEQIIFLGDLFHSHYNSAWESFGQLITTFSNIQFDLVSGNHDILTDHQYLKNGIKLHQEIRITDQILLRHESVAPDGSDDLFQICGHIHPAVRLKGKGLRGEKFPCFWITKTAMILPAFGVFTGVHCITPKKGDRVFFIADKKVIDGQTFTARPS